METPICPICGNALGENESFTMEYFAPRNWWVFYHRKDVSEKETIPVNDSYDMARTNESYRGWCARANVTFASPNIYETESLRGTQWIGF